MSSYNQQTPHRTRLRDTAIDPVHGQNPDYYAETSSNPPTGQTQNQNLHPPPPAYSNSGAMSQQGDPNYRSHSSASRRRDKARRDDDGYGDDDGFQREEMHLEPYVPNHRPRSVPPSYENAVLPRGRRHSRSNSASSDSTLSLSPPRSRGGPSDSRQRSSSFARARGVVTDNFSHTPAGLGAGLLGAVVGGLVASQASNAATRRKQRTDPSYRRSKSDDRARLLGTVAGAIVGGLGANAITTRVQHHNQEKRRRDREGAWTGRGDELFREESFESYRSRGSSGNRSGPGTRGLGGGTIKST